MLESTVTAFNEALFDTDRERAMAVAHEALAQGVTAEEVVFQVVIPAVGAMMRAISENYDTNLAQHFMTAQIASEVTEAMLGHFSSPPEIVGRVVLGTARGDLHSLGKRIVAGCLKSLMIEVIDLGVNVPAERFVEEAVAHEARVIGISAMMVHTARGPEGPARVRQLLHEQGLEKRIKVVVGGAPYRFDEELYREVGADAWAEDGISAGQVIIDLIHQAEAS